jgi:hypothetical protein
VEKNVSMDLKNLENSEEFYIDENWYENRKKGMSAMLRVKDEEEFIEPCLISIKDFFDEIIIALNNCTDATPDIIDRLNLPHVKTCNYPFKLHHNGPGHNQIPQHSVYDNAYFYNWALSKTHFSHVCKWDGDMVALPTLNKKSKRFILKHTIANITGINISGEALARQSKDAPTNTEPRIFRVSRNTYYQQGELTEYFTHDYTSKICSIEDPVFLHFKNVKSITSASQIWPENWREIDVFQKLYRRRESGDVYSGWYPEVLKEKIVTRAIECARKVDELKNQRQVMETIGSLLFELRNRNIQGSLVEIGSLKGKTTVFLSRIAETLFPEHTVVTVDPYSDAGMEKSTHLKSTSEIDAIHACFTKVTRDLKNHVHLKMTSREAAGKLPQDIIFAFIDGEHTFNGVVDDFKSIYERTLINGIIAIDDYNNPAWPEVGQAFHAIKKKYRFRVMLLRTDIKSAYFVKKR